MDRSNNNCLVSGLICMRMNPSQLQPAVSCVDTSMSSIIHHEEGRKIESFRRGLSVDVLLLSATIGPDSKAVYLELESCKGSVFFPGKIIFSEGRITRRKNKTRSSGAPDRVAMYDQPIRKK